MSVKKPTPKAAPVQKSIATKTVVSTKPTPVVRADAVAVAPATKPLKAPKAEKPIKPKLVRDSFTIPKEEYQVLADLKTRLTKLMQPAKKSELLRAGLKVLAKMPDAAIKKALQAVPSIKTGRPAKIIKK
jgi:hypothetical protein